MVFKEGSQIYATEVERKEGENILHINFMGAPFVPSIADDSEVMSRVVRALSQNSDISRVVFVQQRNYHYSTEQVFLLSEIARVHKFLLKDEEILSEEKLSLFGRDKAVRGDLVYILDMLLKDPLGAYIEVKGRAKEYRGRIDSGDYSNKSYLVNYVRLMERIQGLLEGTKIVQENMNFLSGKKPGDREIYDDIFRADVLPNFTFTRLVAQIPEEADFIDQYEVKMDDEGFTVTILKIEGEGKYFYHVMPIEYSLNDEQQMLVNLARNVLAEHRPKAEEFTDPGKTRQVFFNVARDLLSELSRNKNIDLNYRELNKLSRVLVRHTIGFGLIEVLLADRKIQDIVLNAPIAQNRVFVRHQDYDECVTNVIPSYEDADSWAAKLRLQSGRPLDEANPVLDTDLDFGVVRARVAAVTEPLSPKGLTYAFRRHRDEPWTLPLFIENKMINSLAAGLLSFIIDGGRTLLVAGTRSSGKTSLLGSLMLEIMQKYRTIVVEDSVTKDSEIIYKENGKFKKATIEKLVDNAIKKNGFVDSDGREKELNSDGIEIFSVDKDGKTVLSKPSKFIRHKCNKDVYEVKTSSGRSIKVTKDHSLFTFDDRELMKEVKPGNLKKGDFVALPRKLPFNSSMEDINLIEKIDLLKKMGKDLFVLGKDLSDYIRNNRSEITEIAKTLGYKKSTRQNWFNKGILPLNVFHFIKSKIDRENLFLKSKGCSGKIPVKVILDKDFLGFIGLWIADGCYDSRSVIISVKEEENKAVVRKIADRFGAPVKLHSDGFSSMINSSLLKEIMFYLLDLKGNSYTKRMPNWTFDLSDEQTGWLLKGYFSGDGCVSDKEITFSSCSKKLVEDISTMLLRYGIILRYGAPRKRASKNKAYGIDNTISCRIGMTKMIELFRKNIGFFVESKQNNLDLLASRVSNHDFLDVIPLSLESKRNLKSILGSEFNDHDYVIRDNNIGREKLSQILKIFPKNCFHLAENLNKIAKSDIFWDKVLSVEKIEYDGFVYDISVPGNENFVCENIIAHNTLELPVGALRKLGYDILSMKVRSALVQGSTEIEASEGIRTSLRLGDSALIVGEVRSDEAKALYEAMRVGALANVVAGTIHGDSPYGVFDRVVNDLGVPTTSFKATDIIIVTNPVKSADGLSSKKRVMKITEVRKHWNNDPESENGFVDLMKYNVETDELEPTEALLNGDSEILKSIAGNVKGWAGDWDALWDNIILRGKIKQEIVEMSKKLKKPEMLEAKFNSLSNDAFHNISEEILNDAGSLDEDFAFEKWKQWAVKMSEKF